MTIRDDRTADADGDNLAIAAAGAYAPELRIDADTVADAWGSFDAKGIEEKAVAEGDEDALTMAVEAAERTLEAAGHEGSDLAALAVATTTPPMAEEDLTARLGSALGAPADVTGQVFTGSTRAGTRALAAALDADRSPALVVASDCPRAEPADGRDHAAGAGAAALVLESANDSNEAVTVDARSEYTEAYPGTRFRQGGSERVDGIDVRSYDRRAFIETVGGAVEAVSGDTGDGDGGITDVDAAAIQAPDGDLPYRAARSLPVDTDQVSAGTVVSELGDLGAASALAGTVRALSEGCASLLVVGYGSGGGADAFVLSGSCPTALALDGERSVDYAGYLRRRGEITPDEPTGGGAYVSIPAWTQSLPQRHRLAAGRCPECGALAYPPEGACKRCHGLVDFERVRLPRRGTVETVTGISRGGAPPEFAVQQAKSGDLQVTVVEFAVDDETVSVPLQGVLGADSLSPGDEVETALRRLYTQEGVTRYARKARPVGDDTD